MLVETLRKQWDARACAPLHVSMTFVGDELVLGADTRLAAVDRAASGAKDKAARDARLIALLSATFGRSIGASILAHIGRALVKKRQGDTTHALMHLALTGLPKLTQATDDARRLFVADGLMKEGVTPRTILQAMELDTETLDEVERAYNREQPRVPSGNGLESGRWTNGNAGDGSVLSDPARATNERQANPKRSNQDIQVADNSADWFRSLNPISEAEAAQTGRPDRNGRAQYDQHQMGVEDAMAAYEARGYAIAASSPIAVTIPGFLTPRYYDFIAREPVTDELIGVEVKTTYYDTIFLDDSQVEKDFALIKNRGVYVPALAGKITSVAYEAFCNGCSIINLRKADLIFKLLSAKVPFRFTSWPGGSPPI
jgi:hypothetical protein